MAAGERLTGCHRWQPAEVTACLPVLASTMSSGAAVAHTQGKYK